MTQASVVRFLILGLPVGLIAGVVAAMSIYTKERNAPKSNFGHVNRPVQRDELKRNVEMMANTIGSRHATEPDRVRYTVKFLQGVLDPVNMGYPNTAYRVSQQTFSMANGAEALNLVVEIPGSHPEHGSEIVLVGAHYDSALGSPGADANASGVAAGLSLARAFAGTSQERILRFVFFANGDTSFTGSPERGSEVYAAQCKKAGEKVVAMVNLDSLACYSTLPGSQLSPPGAKEPLPDTGDFLAIATTPGHELLARSVQTFFARESTLPLSRLILDPGARDGDDAPFIRQGYPAFTLTDTGASRKTGALLPIDGTDTLDYERFSQAVLGTQSILRQLANPERSGGK